MPDTRAEGIDHVHVHVADRAAAAAWYKRVLGLSPDPRFAVWAEDQRGPLMLAGGEGGAMVALFGNRAAGAAPGATVAFRIDGAGFDAFVAALPDLGLADGKGGTLAAADVVDHDLARSLYFVDPDGNRIELTTYDRQDRAG